MRTPRKFLCLVAVIFIAYCWDHRIASLLLLEQSISFIELVLRHLFLAMAPVFLLLASWVLNAQNRRGELIVHCASTNPAEIAVIVSAMVISAWGWWGLNAAIFEKSKMTWFTPL